MRHPARGLASLTGGCLAAAAIASLALADGACYLPVEVEADQAIRLGIELKIVGKICRDASYESFSQRNGDTLAAYEQILGEHLARNDAGPGDADVAAYIKNLEKTAGESAVKSASFCADAFDTVALYGGMHPADLLAYAAAKAEAVKQDYALCTVPAPPAEAPGPAPPIVTTNVPAEPAPLSRPLESDEEAPLAVGDTALARLLSPVDRQLLHDATQRTLETVRSGQMVGWRSGRNGGTVVATRAFLNPESQWCRRFEQQVILDGTTRRATGLACRRADGIWEIAPQP
jgi:hypothetical protein